MGRTREQRKEMRWLVLANARDGKRNKWSIKQQEGEYLAEYKNKLVESHGSPWVESNQAHKDGKELSSGGVRGGLQASVNLLALRRRLGALVVGDWREVLVDCGRPVAAVLAVTSDTARLAGLIHNREG